VIVLAGGRVAADGRPVEALRPEIIDAAYGVGFRTVILDGVDQPVAWTRLR
jgi:ABC-type hemin transport system ATPase subunit